MRLLIVLITLAIVLMAVAGCTSWQVEQAHPPIGAFVEVDGAKLHYVDMGPGDSGNPPVVLFHGASANLKDMKLALGDALADKTRVIIFDRPGRGYSTRPDDGYRLDVQARLMHDALVKLDVEKPIVLGQSLGGAVALAYALEYQDEMSGLMVLAAVSHEWPGGVAWYNNASSTPVVGFLLRRTIIPVYGRWQAPAGIDGAFWPRKAPENYFEASGLPLLFRPKDFKSNAADIAHLKAEIIDMMGRYEELAIPTQIYTGTHDTTVSPTIHSYILDRQIPNSELTIIPFEGHGLHHTSKALILEGVDALMAELAQSDEQEIVSPNEGIAAQASETP